MWASFCLNRTPIACLVAAVLTFSAGLVAWTFSSSSGTLVRISASTLTGTTVVIVVTIVIWEVREQVRDYTHSRTTYLSDPVPSTLSKKWGVIKNLPRDGIKGFLRVIHDLISLLAPGWRIKLGSDEQGLPKPFDPLNRGSICSVRQESCGDGLSRLGTTLQSTNSLGASHFQNGPPDWSFPPVPNPESAANEVSNYPQSITTEELSSNLPKSPLRGVFMDRVHDLGRDPSLRTMVRSSRMGPSSLQLAELENMRPPLRLMFPLTLEATYTFRPTETA